MIVSKFSNTRKVILPLFHPKKLISYKNKTNINCPRLYHLITRNYGINTSELKTPDLVYFPQILRWLRTKIGFKLLQKTWDPEFTEGAFIYGSTKAICRITEEIQKEDKDGDLQKLVTPPLRKKLLSDILTQMTDLQKKIIVLTPHDIKLLIPIEVKLRTVQDKRYCTISLRSLAIKWQDINGSLRLAIVALQTEFVRDYTDAITKQAGWTVRLFDILECGVVGEAKVAKKQGS